MRFSKNSKGEDPEAWAAWGRAGVAGRMSQATRIGSDSDRRVVGFLERRRCLAGSGAESVPAMGAGAGTGRRETPGYSTENP